MHKEKPFHRWMLVALGLAALVVPAGGAWFWRSQAQLLQRSAEIGLESIARLKADEISAWRAVQLRNGRILMEDPFLHHAVANWMALGQADDAAQILAQFRLAQKHYQYVDVLLVDAEGRIRLSLGGVCGDIHPEARQTLSAALSGQTTLLTDLHAGPGGLPPHVDIAVPFFSQDGELAAPLGAVFLLVDARQYLYPIIGTWPVPSRSAETLLVRREEASVLFLNDLRHRPGAALSLRVPLDDETAPAVMAVKGREGVVPGKDYRGAEVLSALKAVPDSPWFMVAKVDAAEVFAEWHSRSGLIVSLIALSMVCASAAAATIWQRGKKLDLQNLVQAQAALQKSESRMRAITDSAQDAILMMDADGRVSYWNPAAERILGHTGAEAIGRDLHALIAPERFHAGHAAAFPEFVRTGRGGAVGKTIELKARHKDGHEISVDLSLSAVQGAGGWHAVGILRDTSERKRADEALRETNRELEEATLHANEMAVQAEMANAAKSEFLANMSHEIRTPMNGVIGMTGLLLDTELTAEQRRYGEIVRSSAESLLGLINDILDFSKIEARKLELEKLDFDLRVALEDTAEMLAGRAHAKGIELICWIAPEVPSRLRGDPGRLRQVVLNMAGNAIKFTDRGEVSLRVGLESEDAERAALRLEITDTGIGIPEKMIPQLFSPFTQVDGSTTRKFGGTGLGLAISKQLAELMGGRVGVASRPDAGSTFWFTAVFDKPNADRSAPEEHGELRGIRVLVVDDNETNRLLLATLLKSWRCLFEEAPDAAQAMEALERAAAGGNPFDIAILDMLMPFMDGMELGRRIKASSALRDTRLVMMTSLGERGQAKRLKAIGFSGYLTKPIRQSQVRECLALVMGRAPQASSAPLEEIITRHTVAESRKRRLRLLVAEDNATNQILALEILKKLGYRADVAANGVEAVSAVQATPYDLVLMDCQMPEMDGFEATRKIRALEAESGTPQAGEPIPIIAMTAHALKGDRERCLEAGMSDYLSKPVRPNDLALMLERWLKHAGGASRTAPDPPEQRSPAPCNADTPAAAGRDLIDAERGAAVFDRDGFMNRVMDDGDLAETITRAFLTDMPVQIEKLTAAAADRDFRQSEQQAHRIRGAAANLGAVALEQAALALEQAGKAGDALKLQELMPQVPRQFEILRAVLEKALAEPARP